MDFKKNRELLIKVLRSGKYDSHKLNIYKIIAKLAPLVGCTEKSEHVDYIGVDFFFEDVKSFPLVDGRGLAALEETGVDNLVNRLCKLWGLK